MGDLVDEPFVLPCHLSHSSQLVFNLYRETATAHSLEEVLIGSGVSMIDRGHQLDHKREGLRREHIASIIARDTLDCIALCYLHVAHIEAIHQAAKPSRRRLYLWGRAYPDRWTQRFFLT